MSERVIVRQDSEYRIEMEATDPQGHGAGYQPVGDITDLTPFGMVLAGLGSCTTILLHSYSQQHGVDLDEVEVELAYAPVEQEDSKYNEKITAGVTLRGDLSDEQHAKLQQIARRCAVHGMLEKGLHIDMAESVAA